MGKDNDRLSRRLGAISAAKPVDAPTLRPVALSRADPRRKEPRQQTYRFASIAIGRQTVLRCIVRDLSASGARIALEGAAELPAEVILAIEQTGRRFRARVAWRSEHEAGLCFTGEIQSKPRVVDLRGPQNPAPATVDPEQTGRAANSDG